MRNGKIDGGEHTNMKHHGGLGSYHNHQHQSSAIEDLCFYGAEVDIIISGLEKLAFVHLTFHMQRQYFHPSQ